MIMQNFEPIYKRGVPIWIFVTVMVIITVVVCVGACFVGAFIATPITPLTTQVSPTVELASSPSKTPSQVVPSSTSTLAVSPTISNTPTITFTPSKTPTPTKTSPPTKTPDPRTLYNVIDIRELDGYTDDHIGKLVKIEGKVFNVGTDFFQVNIRKPGGSAYDTIPVVVTYLVIARPPGIYEDTNVIIYGTVFGRQDGTNAFGASISQLRIDAAIIEVK
jgi:hypothetical protein